MTYQDATPTNTTTAKLKRNPKTIEEDTTRKAINEQKTHINGIAMTARIRRKREKATRQMIPSTVKRMA